MALFTFTPRFCTNFIGSVQIYFLSKVGSSLLSNVYVTSFWGFIFHLHMLAV